MWVAGESAHKGAGYAPCKAIVTMTTRKRVQTNHILVIVALGWAIQGCGGRSDVTATRRQATRAFTGSWTQFQHHMTEHAALLAGGQVMLWGWLDDTRPALWDPTTKTLKRSESPPEPMFHGGNTAYADGRLLIVGGGFQPSNGAARLFSPTPPPGQPLYEPLGRLSVVRFYPTALLLASGAVFVASGDYVSEPGGKPSQGLPAEMYDPTSNRWGGIGDTSQPGGRLRSADVYPTQYLLPSGRILYLPMAEGASNVNAVQPPALLELGPPDDGSGLSATSSGWRPLPMNLPRRRSGGSALLIDDTGPTPRTQVLIVGDGQAEGSTEPAPNRGTVDLVDLTDEANPRLVPSVPGPTFGRGFHTSVVPLPTGDVLVLDGNGGTPTPPELFRVRQLSWSVAGSAPQFPREEHEVAVLLPSGAVLASSDGARTEGVARSHNDRIEVFTPSFVAGPRPQIESAPATAANGDQITVVTSEAADAIDSACLLRVTSVTHGTDPGKRYIKLAKSRPNGSLRVRIPAPNTAPPGLYLLHVVDTDGTPSPGRFILIR
jgi:hypothetical protein